MQKNQFGIRKHRNTELVSLSLLDKVLQALEDKKYAICVFLDYSACFDTLSRSILYDKLERQGIRICSNDESILYADDTVLLYIGTSLEMLTEHVKS